MPSVMMPGGPPRLRAAALEFGGVVAEDGFREAIRQLAERNRQHPDIMQRLAREALLESGYLVGACTHVEFWTNLQRRVPLRGKPGEFSDLVVLNYALRDRVLAAVRTWRKAGLSALLLCDNTDWLDRVNARSQVFREFDRVLNSFHVHKSKRDGSLYQEAAQVLQVQPQEILVVDTSADALGVARKMGFQTLLFATPDRFLAAFEEILGRNAGR